METLTATVEVGTAGPYYPSWYADVCVQAVIKTGANAVANNDDWIHPDGCGGTAASMASGWIGVEALEFMNGSYCGYAEAYNGSTTGGLGVGGVLCGNPAGTQIWYTQAAGGSYTEINGSYTTYWWPTIATSPNQDY
jgi:hypothetical protein